MTTSIKFKSSPSILTPELRGILIDLLKEFEDVFVYSVKKMPGIYPEKIVHRQNVDPNLKPDC